MTWLLVFIIIFLAVTMLIGGDRLLKYKAGTPEDMSDKWLLGIYLAICTGLLTACLSAVVGAHCEHLDDEEYKLIQKFRIERKQKALAKELERLNNVKVQEGR